MCIRDSGDDGGPTNTGKGLRPLLHGRYGRARGARRLWVSRRVHGLPGHREAIGRDAGGRRLFKRPVGGPAPARDGRPLHAPRQGLPPVVAPEAARAEGREERAGRTAVGLRRARRRARRAARRRGAQVAGPRGSCRRRRAPGAPAPAARDGTRTSKRTSASSLPISPKLVNAASTSTKPWPWLHCATPGSGFAVASRTRLTASGAGFLPEAFAALNRHATAPAAFGAAIDVPCMSRCGWSEYLGTDATAPPGAATGRFATRTRRACRQGAQRRRRVWRRGGRRRRRRDGAGAGDALERRSPVDGRRARRERGGGVDEKRERSRAG